MRKDKALKPPPLQGTLFRINPLVPRTPPSVHCTTELSVPAPFCTQNGIYRCDCCVPWGNIIPTTPIAIAFLTPNYPCIGFTYESCHEPNQAVKTPFSMQSSQSSFANPTRRSSKQRTSASSAPKYHPVLLPPDPGTNPRENDGVVTSDHHSFDLRGLLQLCTERKVSFHRSSPPPLFPYSTSTSRFHAGWSSVKEASARPHQQMPSRIYLARFHIKPPPRYGPSTDRSPPHFHHFPTDRGSCSTPRS